MTHDPSRALPVLPLRRGVALPGQIVTLPVGSARSLRVARDLRRGDHVILAPERPSDDAASNGDDGPTLHPIGVRALVREVHSRDARVVLSVEVLSRVRLHRVVDGHARFDPMHDPETGTLATERADSLRTHVGELLPAETDLIASLKNSSPGHVADLIAGFIDLSADDRLAVLLELDVEQRLELVVEHVREAKARAELRSKVDNEVRREIGKGQREQILRRQLQAIKKELGESDGDDRTEQLADALDAADLPEEAREVADRELERLRALPAQSPETHVIRTYLEWIAALPWNARADDEIELRAIEEKLESDHHGLDDVKRRVLEHMALVKRLPDAGGSVLCLSGPPGVGKTSLAQSVADATGRPLVRVSLGGVRDEAEIRGHRRTYIGALPGRILTALRTAKVKNPVVVLDEVDKVTSRGWAGDPEAALLELLDPEQNHGFTDHYLELPFDLSEVLFICTANDLSQVSPPLRDRLEVIEVQGYPAHDKVQIARRHLLPRVLEKHGLAPEALVLDDAELEWLVVGYTREAGVRQLERVLAKLARDAVLREARATTADSDPMAEAPDVGSADRREMFIRVLGAPRVPELAERERPAGVAAGLAWTPVGGDVLYVETARMPGKGRVEITGQLGEVMTESARTALAFLRTRSDSLGLDANFMEHTDLHVHVPAGGVPKDGPSAGVTLFTALASLVTGRRVRPDTAMTGEATLRGRVLPVGGIPSKLLAAHRAGFERVLVPKRNERDLAELPEAVRAQLEIVLVEQMDEVLDLALEPVALDLGRGLPGLDPSVSADVATESSANPGSMF